MVTSVFYEAVEACSLKKPLSCGLCWSYSQI